MNIPNQIRSSKLGGCPACHEAVYANLELAVGLRLPGTIPQGSSYVEAKAEMTVVGMAVNRQCGTRPDFLPEAEEQG